MLDDARVSMILNTQGYIFHFIHIYIRSLLTPLLQLRTHPLKHVYQFRQIFSHLLRLAHVRTMACLKVFYNPLHPALLHK